MNTPHDNATDTTAAPAAPASPMGFDLGGVQDVFTTEIELFHPQTGVGLKRYLTLAGPEHPARKNKILDIRRAARAALSARNAKVRDVEEDDAENIELAVTATLGWRGIRFNGSDAVFTPALARDLYKDPAHQWVLRQVGAALNDLTLFIKA